MKLLLIALSLSICSIVSDKTGSWAYSVDDGQGGTIDADIVLEMNDGEYEGHILGSDGTVIPLDELVVEDEDFSCTFNWMGYEIGFEGTFDGNKLKVTGSVEGYEFTFIAEKAE